MATHEQKAKAPKRQHLGNPASTRGPKPIDYVGIDKAAHPAAKTLIAEWLPDNAERVKYDGRSGKWRYERKTGKHLTKLRMCIAGITRSEAAKEIAERLSISPHDASLKKNDNGLCNPPRTHDPLPIAVSAIKPNAGAETLLGLYHKVAARASGAFVLAHIAPATTKEAGKRPLHVQRFRINDAAGMAAEARSRGACENVYFGPALMRTDLAKGKRGEEGDITAVLAIVLEEDGDTGKLVAPCGIAPTFEIETSHAPTLNRHFHFVFDRPLSPQDAKALAILAHRKCGGDSGGKDISHVWRVPDTLNFPDWRKLARGRPETPQPVKLIGGTGKPVDVERFRAALEAMPNLHPELKAAEGADWRAGGSKDRAAIIERLKPRLVSKIQEEGKDRSAHCFSVLMALFDANLTDDEVLIVSAGAPFARKFDERGDLEEEIGRSRARWAAQKQQGPADGEEGDAEPGDEKKTQAQKLIELADDIELFHDADKNAYALAIEGERRLVSRVQGRDFKLLLLKRYHLKHSGGPNDEALRTALRTLEARAIFDGKTFEVSLRTARHGGNLYLNLGRDDGAIVEVTSADWHIVEDAPVRFLRSQGMLPLPMPERGGSITALARFMNLDAKADFILATSWLIGALGRGPYPIAAFTGEQGAAKSTSTRCLRKILDPNKALLRSLPREERDLAITAQNSHVLTFDNLSGLPAWTSDALCKLATGGGFSCRELYSNDGEWIFDALRPIIMNGIEDFATRSDLASRCIFLKLKPILEDGRKTEAELDALFEQEAAKILGALLDAVAYGLANPVTLPSKPRMADFAEWAASCEGYFVGTRLPFQNEDGASEIWRTGDFSAAYSKNWKEATEIVLDADSIAGAVLAFMDGRTAWSGSATDLLSNLAGLTKDEARRDREWPSNSQKLSGRLTRLAPALRKSGIDIAREKLPGGARVITLKRVDDHIEDAPQATEKGNYAPDAPKDDEIEKKVRENKYLGTGGSKNGVAPTCAHLAPKTPAANGLGASPSSAVDLRPTCAQTRGIDFTKENDDLGAWAHRAQDLMVPPRGEEITSNLKTRLRI